MFQPRCILTRRVVLSLMLAVLSICLLLRSARLKSKHEADEVSKIERMEYARNVVGSWHIPPTWLHRTDSSTVQYPLTSNASALEAAEHASELAISQQAFLNRSEIPLIIHHLWFGPREEAWQAIVPDSVSKWICAARQSGCGSLSGPEMAWIFWDSDSIREFMRKYELDLYKDFQSLPYAVEKSDVFRIVVLKWLGGVYADADSEPLKHPYEWIYESDLTPWKEASLNRSHALPKGGLEAHGETTDYRPNQEMISHRSADSSSPINAILGVEADAPDPAYWRRGFRFAVQLTNWALAMSPHHPVATQYIQNLQWQIVQSQSSLSSIDPVNITGPAALTAAVRDVTQKDEASLPWEALSGLNGDPKGGRGKVVNGDTLILPITGFNPGRPWWKSMGSQAITHPNARLRHAFVSSWRKGTTLKVEYGKFCRQWFGMCRYWSQFPESS